MSVKTETRGRKLKYDLTGMEMREVRIYPNSERTSVFNQAKYFAKTRSLDWSFSCKTLVEGIQLTRIK